MSKLSTSAEAHIDAPAELVLEIIRDFDGHHRRILPPAFSAFEVEQGGHGHGTIMRFRMTLGGRTTEERSLASEPEPGVIREQILGRDMVTTFRVVPDGDGAHATISTEWTPAGGLSGILERLFVPGMLRKVYVQELALLADYAASLRAVSAGSAASVDAIVDGSPAVTPSAAGIADSR